MLQVFSVFLKIFLSVSGVHRGSVLYIFCQIILHYSLLQVIEYSSLCHILGSCLFISGCARSFLLRGGTTFLVLMVRFLTSWLLLLQEHRL